MHLGHAYSALLNASFANNLGGRLLLRIEDIDLARSRLAFEAAILEDLAWLGLVWEKPVRRQSEQFPDYAVALDDLRARDLVYPCFCTRQEVAAEVRTRETATGRPWPRDPDGTPLYPKTCRALSNADAGLRIAQGAPATWRLTMNQALAAVGKDPLTFQRFEAGDRVSETGTDPARWGDAVLARKEIPTSYHLSVVVDDALQGVTHVVRGRDLEASTDLHVLLQRLLGLPPPRYHHHALILDERGRKLSKSLGSEPLGHLRERGVSPAGIRQQLGLL